MKAMKSLAPVALALGLLGATPGMAQDKLAKGEVQQIAEEAMSEHGFTVSSLGGEGPVPEGWTPWPEGRARSAVRAVQEPGL